MADPTPQQIEAMKKQMEADVKKAIAAKAKVAESIKDSKTLDATAKDMKIKFKSEPD